jgi:hypothetical protein
LAIVAVLAGSLSLFVACNQGSPPATDRALLDSAITVAYETHDSAVEGTDAGLYRPGSKARFFRAIVRARIVARDVDATPDELDTAVMYLGIATTIFDAEIVDTNAEIFSGTVTDSIMIPRMSFEHLFIFTLGTDNTYTLFDTVAAFREKVFLQMGSWRKSDDSCTFTSSLCMTLDIVSLKMVLDTLMAPYTGEIADDTMTIHEFGYLGAASFQKQ